MLGKLFRLIILLIIFYSMIVRTQQEWTAYAKIHKRSYFYYQDKVLDLTSFMRQHPGGEKALIPYVNKDITEILFKVYPHSKESTLKTLEKYKIGNIKNQEQRKRTLSPIPQQDKSAQKQKKKVCFDKDVLDAPEPTLKAKDNKKSKKSSQSLSKKSKKSKQKKYDVSIKLLQSEEQSKITQISNQKQNIVQTPRNKQKVVQTPKKMIESSKIKTSDTSNNQKEHSSKKTMIKTKKSATIQQDFNVEIDISQFDQEKPIFRVPVLQIKNMSCLGRIN